MRLTKGRENGYYWSMRKLLGMAGFWLTALIGVYLLFITFSPLIAGILLLIMAGYLLLIFSFGRGCGAT